MTSSDDLVGGDEGPAAHQRATHSSPEESDLVRELPGVGGLASNDLASAPRHRGGEELGGELLGSSGREGHHTQEDCCSHDDQLMEGRLSARLITSLYLL